MLNVKDVNEKDSSHQVKRVFTTSYDALLSLSLPYPAFFSLSSYQDLDSALKSLIAFFFLCLNDPWFPNRHSVRSTMWHKFPLLPGHLLLL